MLLLLAASAATTTAMQAVPSSLSERLAKANISRPVAGWCAGEFRPGRTGAYAVAVTSTTGGGRYLVVESDATVVELGGFTGGADVSCYSPAEAQKMSDTIRQSDTVQGSITPQYSTTLVCAFIDDTSAVCWQYSPSKGAFVKVGSWVT